MLSGLEKLEKDLESTAISSKDELEQFRLKFLSRKGLLSQLFEDLKSASKEEKPLLGKKLNELKQLAENKYEENKQKFETGIKGEEIDLSMPGRTFSSGREHIVARTLNDFCSIFRRRLYFPFQS